MTTTLAWLGIGYGALSVCLLIADGEKHVGYYILPGLLFILGVAAL